MRPVYNIHGMYQASRFCLYYYVCLYLIQLAGNKEGPFKADFHWTNLFARIEFFRLGEFLF